MLIDTPDPVAAWQEFSARQSGYVDYLGAHDTIRVVGPDTDITMRTAGRRWISADGHLNFPDGEVFTGPIEDSVNGTIRYTFPTVFMGREAEDVQLWFEDGRVTRWEAKRGKPLLDHLLTMDDGARRLGEFAIGTNYAVPVFTKSILFDEKIGGTCHLAVGRSIPLTGGRNESNLHWDMVCDLRQGGEISADGEVFHRDGKWLI
jgi:aminopeptidase